LMPHQRQRACMPPSLLASACAQSRAHRRLNTCAPPSPARQQTNQTKTNETPSLFLSICLCAVHEPNCSISNVEYNVVHTRAFSAAAGSASTTGCAPSDLDRIRRKLIRKQVHVTSAAGTQSCAVTAERHPRKLKAKVPAAATCTQRCTAIGLYAGSDTCAGSHSQRASQRARRCVMALISATVRRALRLRIVRRRCLGRVRLLLRQRTAERAAECGECRWRGVEWRPW
jgi:hypothetical protein